jgi:hypothetical protein
MVSSEDVRTAFLALLTNANLGVTLYARDVPAYDENSVVIYMVTGKTSGAGFGSTSRHETWLVQISCYSDDVVKVGNLRAAVANALLAQANLLETAYGLRNLEKFTDTDMGRQNTTVNEFQAVQTWSCESDFVPTPIPPLLPSQSSPKGMTK